jgi:hypothetical protein
LVQGEAVVLQVHVEYDLRGAAVSVKQTCYLLCCCAAAVRKASLCDAVLQGKALHGEQYIELQEALPTAASVATTAQVRPASTDANALPGKVLWAGRQD